ncbi:MAG: DUF6286 domain-containing protein [Jatrophihabitans sp.]
MRQLNRLLGALLSVLLIAAGVMLIIEVIADRITHKPAIVHWHRLYEWAGRTQWQAGAVRVICVLLIMAGLILLIAELKPTRVSRLSLAEEVPGIDSAYTRRGVAAAVKAAVADVDGIRTVNTRVSRRTMTVTAMAGAADRSVATQLTGPVTTAAQQRLDSLRLRSAPSVSATVKPRSS